MDLIRLTSGVFLLVESFSKFSCPHDGSTVVSRDPKMPDFIGLFVISHVFAVKFISPWIMITVKLQAKQLQVFLCQLFFEKSCFYSKRDTPEFSACVLQMSNQDQI